MTDERILFATPPPPTLPSSFGGTVNAAGHRRSRVLAKLDGCCIAMLGERAHKTGINCVALDLVLYPFRTQTVGSNVRSRERTFLYILPFHFDIAVPTPAERNPGFEAKTVYHPSTDPPKITARYALQY